MNSLFVILNHPLSNDQILDLTADWGFTNVVTLTPEQKAVWAQIPAEGDAYEVRKHIQGITGQIWEHDAVICQGEFTAFTEVYKTCQLADKPLLVACSKRETVETVNPDGTTTKTAVFKHVQFRQVNRA